MSEPSRDNNQRTVADYERTARDYVDTVNGKPSAIDDALRRLAAAVTPGTRVLDVGSGPGWDADRLEDLGVDVHRTDAAAAFCDFQTERGERCDRLDPLSDRIDGRYGGVMMLCVLQHFERTQLDGALCMLGRVLDAGGPMLSPRRRCVLGARDRGRLPRRSMVARCVRCATCAGGVCRRMGERHAGPRRGVAHAAGAQGAVRP